MKKKKLIKLIIFILIIVAIILFVKNFINKKEDVHRLAQIYEQLNSSQTYLFEMKRNDNNKIIMAQKDGKTLVDQYSDTEHVSTIVKEDSTYFVMHNREEYYIYSKKNIEQNIVADEIKNIIEKTYVTGTEKIKGKKYYYEEYSGSTIFIISNNLDISNEDNVKTRFFFDNNGNITHIKTIAQNNQELLEINLQYEITDSMFEIPSNYAEN